MQQRLSILRTNRPYWFVLAFLFSAVLGRGQEETAESIIPQIGQRGTEVTALVQGTLLDTAEEILFYQKGITCTKIEQLSEYSWNGKTEKAEPGMAIQVTFNIAKDARIGEYFFRIRTKRHLSEMLSFWVTKFPVVEEVEPFSTKNDEPEFAQLVPLNSTVVGYQPQGPPNDFDYYKVKLSAGQRCTAQILSARLGTYHYAGLTDMALEVRSPSGKRVARCDDSPLFSQDPMVSFIAEEPGEYLVLARQQMDYETAVRHYALHIGDFERPAVTYPLGGKAGDELTLRVFLGDGEEKTEKVKLPKSVGEFEEALINYGGDIPSPNQLKVADFQNVMEEPGHNKPENAQSIGQSLPIALNGIVEKEGEKDWYKITAKKGERYRVRAYARTLGSKLDPFIWVRPAEGNKSSRLYEEDDSLWDGHDWEGHHYRHQVKDRLDPVFMFEPDEDGDYLIGVGDTRREFGKNYIYRIEIQPHRDTIFTHFPPYPSKRDITRDVINIHRGSTFSRPIAIQNGFGARYDGPMTLEAKGLPAEITFECPVFTKNDLVILTTFSAPDDADLKCGLFELIPKPVDEKANLGGAFAMTTGSTQQRGSYDMVFNKTRFAAFAVVEKAPFSVKLEQPKVGLAKDAELELKVTVERKEGFDGAIYAEMDWVPPGLTKQPPMVIEAGKNEGFYKISATNQAKDGTYQLSINCRENEGGNVRTGLGFHFVTAPFIEIKVLDPYLTIELERAAIEQGKTGGIVGKIKHFRKFEGVAQGSLLRLPTGVELVEPAKIESGDETVTFKLKVAEDALVGQAKEISADIEIKDGGQKIHQQSGDGVLRIDAKRK